jgi:hypothetical protein
MDNKIWKGQNYRRDKKEMRELARKCINVEQERENLEMRRVLMCFEKRHEISLYNVGN